MKTATFPTIGTLDTTLPATSDPLYQSASLCLDLHLLLKEISDEGFVLTQPESTDFSTFANGVTDGMDDYIDRYEEILAGGFSSILANIPDVLPIITTLLSGGSEPVMAILLKGVLDVLLRQFDVRITDNEGEIEAGTADMSGVVTQLEALEEKLEEMRVQIATILTEFNVTVVQTREPLDDVAEWTVGFPLPPS